MNPEDMLWLFVVAVVLGLIAFFTIAGVHFVIKFW